ncbi:MAG: valine--tRNA ligase [Nanoarchaeota archaeon]|nr:valine--tRNA ligase [Nanoarchaeota archaeon]
MKLSEIKNWSPEIEKVITEKWKNSEPHKFDANSKKKIYSIDTPPPYVNAPIHIGQAVTYCYMDFFARFKRMQGYEVLFPLGLDRNGLPIEMAAEKKFKVSPFNVGREKFMDYCKKILESTSSETSDTFAKLGISFTSYKEGPHIGAVYLTDSPEYRGVTQATFIELFKKGLIYEDVRINNWDPKLQTTIADSEIEYKDIESNFNDVKWGVKETGEEIVIGTTRPELICTCGMVIFNPGDKRYKHLDGKTAISPIFGKEIPIKSHPLAQIEKGTGLAMMCSAGDLSDIQFFREMGLKPEIAIERDGKMNKIAGPLKGLKVHEAREKIISLLKERKLLVKQEKIFHRTPVAERSGAEVEFISMPEYYLKQIEFKKDMKKISKDINFYPKTAKKILDDWIDSVSIDWPISRSRFYATPIPLWIAEKEGKKLYALGKTGKYCEPWKERVNDDLEVYCGRKKIGVVGDFRGLNWVGEEKVFDTWMDSSISELVLLKYKSDDKFFNKTYPCSLRPQGKEIIRTWLYYTILRGFLETDKACFKDVWINQHIVDGLGYKMSKSKGNVIDPQKLLKEYGAEAIRFWAATEGDLSKQDLKCSEERINGEKKTINKILNVSKFVMMFENPGSKPNLTSMDSLFIDYLEDLTKKTKENYEKYNFYNPAIELRKFLWDTFSSHYVEIVKGRAYNQGGKFSNSEMNSARYTLHFLLERFLTLSFPIIPQVTSLILGEKGIKISDSDFPQGKKFKKDFKIIEDFVNFNSLVWKKKKESSIGLRDSIQGVKIPASLKDFEKDLIHAHNLI